jgi:hypothetical protein
MSRKRKGRRQVVTWHQSGMERVRVENLQDMMVQSQGLRAELEAQREGPVMLMALSPGRIPGQAG